MTVRGFYRERPKADVFLQTAWGPQVVTKVVSQWDGPWVHCGQASYAVCWDTILWSNREAAQADYEGRHRVYAGAAR